jgi:hypothetical protein
MEEEHGKELTYLVVPLPVATSMTILLLLFKWSPSIIVLDPSMVIF